MRTCQTDACTTLSAATFERHYQKELAQLEVPAAPQEPADATTGRPGKRGAALAAKNRIMGEASAGWDNASPEKLLQHMQRRIERRDKTIGAESNGGSDGGGGARSHGNRTAGESEPSTSDQQSVCFMCGELLEGDLAQVNAHIDRCLAAPASDPETDNQETPASASATFEEYTWAGQTRVRVTSMLEGGTAGYAPSRRAEEDTNEDLDIDEDDTQIYGPQQYPLRGENIALSDDIVRINGNQGGATEMDTDAEPSGSHAEGAADASFSPPTTTQMDDLSRARLLIDSLKERIRQQESATRTAGKCLICMEAYRKPATSVVCWHVYCEECWLRSLGAKKVCPQCQTITQPADLRRVYM
ncbi:hypothetical protein THASP1DRAFT_27699 [Thamnocephalis sphaerospora]|uniref:RING-type domain-containing protein n=1 Tax=Thamnocephalis sphaerospora TaxID=78915 RepID=A0A4P9XW22_9FUNG|nr:hypothetical protein THASP1DRAFT_27699 [Thamnocephalis sphaerospora]|eukprot:RKP10515.1 hypothetical protein THASP1DRAFT_27699 [Thamnocephalis sphaerospora]